jgi:hypothetical protein
MREGQVAQGSMELTKVYCEDLGECKDNSEASGRSIKLPYPAEPRLNVTFSVKNPDMEMLCVLFNASGQKHLETLGILFSTDVLTDNRAPSLLHLFPR